MTKRNDLRNDAAMKKCLEIGKALKRALWSEPLDHAGFGYEYVIFYMLFLSAERTLASIRALARLGLGADAMALVRVLVEKVITAEYILLSGEETALDYTSFIIFNDWRRYEELRDADPRLCANYTPERIAQMKAAHDRVRDKVTADGKTKPRFGRGHDWTELSLSKRAAKADSLLKEKMNKSGRSRFLFHTTYRNSAAYLHGAFQSIGRNLTIRAVDEEGSEDGPISLDVGMSRKAQSLEAGVEALDAASVAGVQMLHFMAAALSDNIAKAGMVSFMKKVWEEIGEERMAELQKMGDPELTEDGHD